MINDKNLLLLTDSYKASHWNQYPPRTQQIYSYFESRGGMFPETVFFGLQYFLKKYLQNPITMADVQEAHCFYQEHFGQPLMNYEGWKNIVYYHNGRLPVRIKAVPEGTVVGVKNVLMTVENTDFDYPWLTNFLETLLVQVWYPCTVATLSREIKKLIKASLERTGDPSLLPFKLHDFGFRGVSSVESAGIGGAAHLINFQGTDTVAGIVCVKNYYDLNEMPGFSIPATEHSTITSWGRDGEEAAYRNLLEKNPSGLVACVSDSYDIFHAIKNIWGGALKEQVLSRNGTLVIRPDSGEPVKIVPDVLDALGEAFGFTVNEKGFKVLPPQVRVIQGDGVDYESIKAIIAAIEGRAWSMDNLAFGMGGALLQKLNRDTQKFAFKCSQAIVDNKERDVYKSPVTDPGKRSKKGRLSLISVNGSYMTVQENARGPASSLRTFYENGDIVRGDRFQKVRERSAL